MARDEGAALIFLGSPAGVVGSDPSDAHALLESDQTYAEMGTSVGTAGDVNGDGYSDVIVGAPDFDNGEDREGVALVFLGSAAGIVGSNPGSAHALLEGDLVGVYLGSSVGTAGDVDGDGYRTLSSVCPSTATASRTKARRWFFWVRLGASWARTRGAPTPCWRVGSGFAIGRSVGTAGDVNGDGYADVIVGAPNDDDGEADEGGALVFLGISRGDRGLEPGHAPTPCWRRIGPAREMGWSVGTAGDVNGDGYADVIVWARETSTARRTRGRRWSFGSAGGRRLELMERPPGWIRIRMMRGSAGAWGRRAMSTETATQMSSSARTSLTMARWTRGRRWSFSDRPRGIVGSDPSDAHALLESDQANAKMGWSVGTAGDVDGDGRSDVIVGALEYDNGEADARRGAGLSGIG